ncbi:MAG: acyltransferase [Kurthia sp.]|nr:acyltransferase [Candidatus Kurthia equi]
MQSQQLIQLERKFRPEIEGLRVVAALLVAMYHIWFNRVSGGVDVFFVVSGFLITTSIISTINRTGHIKFLPYISKLLKRLLPSVFFILAVVLILSYFFLPESILNKTLKEIVASMFYYENWQLAISNTDYLDSQQMKTPVEHFWAMSIQGQFYVIWFILFAAIVFLIKKYSVKNTRLLMNLILGTLAVLSFGYSIYLTSVNQPLAYFHTFTRVWEFSLGALLCINLSYIKISRFVATIIGWVGLIALVLTGALFNVSEMFPGYVALWPITCAIFILLSGTRNTKFGVKRILASPILVKLGGLSFGIYLWHWVLLSFYHYQIDTGNPSILVGILIIVVSFILSHLMTKFIEKPIRDQKLMRDAFKRISIIGIVNVMLITFFALSIVLQENETAKSKENGSYPGAVAVLGKVKVPSVDPIPSYANVFKDLPQSHIDGTNQTLDKTEVKVGKYGVQENYDATVAVIGSSHSEQWLGAVLKATENKNYRVLNITRSGTRFSSGYKEGDKKQIWVENATKYIKESDIDLVITHATAADTRNQKIQDALADQLQLLADDGIKVLALRDNPRYTFNVLESIEQNGKEATIEKMNKEENQLDEQAWKLLAEQHKDFNLLDLTKYFKNEDKFQPIIGNVVIYRDYDHITNTYAESFAPIFEPQIDKIIKSK